MLTTQARDKLCTLYAFRQVIFLQNWLPFYELFMIKLFFDICSIQKNQCDRLDREFGLFWF